MQRGRRRITVAAPSVGPLGIAGCVLWLRADSVGGAPDAEIAQWNDESGAGNHVTSSGTARPRLRAAAGPGGRACVEFDGVDDYLKATFSVGQPCHLFIVAKFKTTPSAGDTVVDGYPAVNAGRLHASGAGPQFSIYSGTNLYGPVVDTGWHMLEALSNGATSKLQRDSEGYAVGASGSNSPGGIVIGVAGDLATGFTDCYVAELVEYVGVLSDPNPVRDYLTAKYGL